jgi:hypothetical protein
MKFLAYILVDYKKTMYQLRESWKAVFSFHLMTQTAAHWS